jgi:hypothetical protein
MSYGTVGENRVPCHTLAVRPGSGLYIQARGRMSIVTHWAIRLVSRLYVRSEVFKGEPNFLSTVYLFSDS